MTKEYRLKSSFVKNFKCIFYLLISVFIGLALLCVILKFCCNINISLAKETNSKPLKTVENTNHNKENLNNNYDVRPMETLTNETIFLIAMAFVSLIVAIVAFIGVGNVTKVMEIREKFKDDINELENGFNELGKKNIEFKDEINAILSFPNASESLLSSRRYLEACIKIQPGMALKDRIAAAQDLLQEKDIKENWEFFKNILDKELEKENEIEDIKDPILKSNRKTIIALLKRLAKPTETD